jgi:putative hydrolase of HD superfamily
MKRWNDKLRPVELLEVDKQAHKMMVAWVLFMLNSEDMDEAERRELGGRIVEGGLFDYVYRLVITDIKPPVFYKIKAVPEHFRRLTDWVLEQLMPRVQPLGRDFCERLETYLRRTEDEEDLRDRILKAAHLFASNWEFQLIKNVSTWDEEMREIDETFRTGLSELYDLCGVEEIVAGPATPLGRFAHLCGQLRYQKRWSQTPRIPETSVLGHLFIVAAYSYFFSMAVGACEARAQNNFFAGLFHDLPELLTRDIISPVKKSVADIAGLIHEYEEREMERRVYSLFERAGANGPAERLGYLLGRDVGSEFVNTVVLDGKVATAEWDDMQGRYNENRFDPKDGEILKVCDNLAAFLEAYTAVRNGIASDQFQHAMWRFRRDYANLSLAEGLHVGALLADFD